MTVAAVPEPHTKRYMQLVNWLWELGLCWRSRHVLAAAQVEREFGGPRDAKTELSCDDADECRAKAKRGWKSMPNQGTK
jgi:hypothetical protein